MTTNHSIQPKIVIIDDDSMSRLVISKLVSSQGFEPVLFTDGKKAIKYLEDIQGRNKIAAIISDLMMLDSDGIDVLAYVRRANHLDSIPFIFISGAEFEVFQNLLKPYSYQAFVRKPILPAEMIRVLNQFTKLPNKIAV